MTSTPYRDPLRNPKNFLFKAWRYMGLPDPTPLQYDFIEYLNDHRAWKQIHEEARKELLAGTSLTGARKILMAFRGAAKTYVADVNAVYRLRENQEEEVLVVSATEGYASQVAAMAFQMITQFDWLAPDMAPQRHQRQSARAFDVRGARPANKDYSFVAEGVFGQLTGKRATLALVDDIETPNTSDSEVKRATLKHRASEIGGAIIKPGGDILVLGTAQNEQTLYREYAEEKGYELRIYPIVYPRDDKDSKRYGTRLAPLLSEALTKNPLLRGTSTEPTRFDERDILQRQSEWGRTEFDRQFRMFMDAGADNKYPLKFRDLIAIDIPPPSPATGGKVKLPSVINWAPLHSNRLREQVQLDNLPGDAYLYQPSSLDIYLDAEEVICQVDPSGDGEDETSWAIIAGLAGRVYLLKQGGSREGHSDATMQAIAQDCAAWGAQLVKVEKNFGQGMFSSLLKPHLKKAGVIADVEDILASNQVHKERRIVDTLEPLTSSHRLVVNLQVFREDVEAGVKYEDVMEAKRRFYKLSFQFARITKAKGCLPKDDRVDVLAGGCGHFSERLQQALDTEKDKSIEQFVREEAEKIVEARKAAGLPVMGLLEDPHGKYGRGRSKSGHKRPSSKPSSRT